MYKFWMVYSPNEGFSNNESVAKAIIEAETMAKKNPGKTYYLLEAVNAFSVGEPVVECKALEHAPTLKKD